MWQGVPEQFCFYHAEPKLYASGLQISQMGRHIQYQPVSQPKLELATEPEAREIVLDDLALTLTLTRGTGDDLR